MHFKKANPIVKAALLAMKEGNRKAWFGLFSPHASLIQDGIREDFTEWAEQEFFSFYKAFFISIDQVEDDGLTVYVLAAMGYFGSIQAVPGRAKQDYPPGYAQRLPQPYFLRKGSVGLKSTGRQYNPSINLLYRSQLYRSHFH